ncbi:hypothetical protein ACMVAH_004543, partial [Yersinia enterocolitica]
LLFWLRLTRFHKLYCLCCVNIIQPILVSLHIMGAFFIPVQRNDTPDIQLKIWMSLPIIKKTVIEAVGK